MGWFESAFFLELCSLFMCIGLYGDGGGCALASPGVGRTLGEDAESKAAGSSSSRSSTAFWAVGSVTRVENSCLGLFRSVGVGEHPMEEKT